MRELRLPIAGPAIVVVHELEGPTRILLAGADGDDDALRVSEWVSASPVRSEAILAALATVDVDGLDRAASWHEQLGRDDETTNGRPDGRPLDS